MKDFEKIIHDIDFDVREFAAHDDDLDDALDFLNEKLEEIGCGMAEIMSLQVALEELFVNIAHYAYPEGNGRMTLGFYFSDGYMIIQLRDSGTPFNPLAKDDPDVTLSAEERKIGGLGIFIVKKTMDDLYYEHADGQNVFTLGKELKSVAK